MNQVLVSLSSVSKKPTGITTYAEGLFPDLQSLNPTLLVSQAVPNFECYEVPSTLTSDRGTKGHFDRLMWTQCKLPQIYKKLKSELLFSPIPEAPLFSKCRFIVMVHDLIPLRFPKRFSPLTPYHRYYIPQVAAQAEHIICNSHATAKDITDFCQIPASKITPIPLAHNAKHFRPQLEMAFKGESRELCQHHPYYLYIGRHDPHKNLHRVIEAFAALKRKEKDVNRTELWLAGPTDKRHTPALEAQVAELGITQQVKFLNYIPYSELPRVISQAIALVFPSLWEGFGLPVIEAMACGTPVITSNLSSLPEVAGDAAILINPYNVDEITEAMHLVATDNQLRANLSTQGIARAHHFSWEKTGKKTAEVLSQYL
jgi:glycosyltransferase involved in cell wall biosynthesis